MNTGKRGGDYMQDHMLPNDLRGYRMYFVGIKGAGMSALCELCVRLGAHVAGVDTDEEFYTERTLKKAGVSYYEGFRAEHLADEIDLVVYSTAYDPNTHVELLEAKRRNLPILTYPAALGAVSGTMHSVGISGVHGKSTTTGMAGTLLDTLDLPVSVLAGAAISNFDDGPILFKGGKYFVAETCEYQKHFMSFRPHTIVVTSIDHDHPDTFADLDDVISSFDAYVKLLPQEGELIYCADDPGAVKLSRIVAAGRNDVKLVPYGTSAFGRFLIHDVENADGCIKFSVGDIDKRFTLHLPGFHNVLNAVAAIAVTSSLCIEHRGEFTDADAARCAESLSAFRGSTRRSEIIGERDGIVFMDDYAHHPTAIKKTISGLKTFYPSRRIVVDFMPHLFSRTEALFDDFVTSFDDVDILVLNDIYASAREERGNVNGEQLFDAIRKRRDGVLYFAHHEDGVMPLASILKSGDLFVTMGAGDNWQVGRKLLEMTSE